MDSPYPHPFALAGCSYIHISVWFSLDSPIIDSPFWGPCTLVQTILDRIPFNTYVHSYWGLHNWPCRCCTFITITKFVARFPDTAAALSTPSLQAVSALGQRMYVSDNWTAALPSFLKHTSSFQICLFEINAHRNWN